MKLLLLLFFFFGDLFAYSDVIFELDTKAHTSELKDIIITKDKDIITASKDTTIRVWDSNGKLKKKILGQIDTVIEGRVYTIALSYDERYLAVGGYMSEKGTAGVGNIRIYDYQTGKLLTLLKSHKDVVLSLDFSPDGKYLVSASGDKTTKIWNIKDNFILEDTIAFHLNPVRAVKIVKNNGDYLVVSGSDDEQIAMYSLNQRKVINSVKTEAWIFGLAASDEHIAATNGKNGIMIYDYKLNLVKNIVTKTQPTKLAYSKNGKYLISGCFNFPIEVNIYKAKARYIKKKSYNHHYNAVVNVGFLDDETAITVGAEKNEIYIWNINTGKIINKIIGDGQPIFSLGIKSNKIAWGNSDCKIVNCKKLEKSIDIEKYKIKRSLLKSDDFNTIKVDNGIYSLQLTSGDVGKVKDVIGAKLIIKKDNKEVGYILKTEVDGFVHKSYGWYKNYVISGGGGGALNIYNINGYRIASLHGHTGDILSLALDRDRLISAGTDQTIKIWDLSEIKDSSRELKINEEYISIIMNKYKISKENVLVQAKKLNDTNIYLKPKIQKIYPTLTLFISKDNEYIAYTNEGFFTASKNGGQYIGYHINHGPNKEAEYVTVDALYSTFYRPDLIQKALAGESLEKYAKNINIQKLLEDGLAPEVHILSSATKTDKQDMDLKVQVCPKAKGGYDNLTLLINDMPVSVIDTSRALKLKKKSQRDDCFIYDQTISLAGGKNTIGFRATNKAGNIESKPDYLEVTFDDTNLKKKVRSKLEQISGSQNVNDLHILAIAVNEYKDKDLALKYSINDATEMLKTIQDVAKPLFNKVHTYKLLDKEVTKENIKQAFKDIKSTREDVFLLYIAGHGITDEYNGNYYYIPYDFEDKDNTSAVQVQGVGQKDLMLGLSNITALKSLVLLDTCNSGSFVEANMQKTTTNRLARATGRATISASSKSQVALEGYEGHGVFTYTLIEALKGKGYKDDKKITINELNDYVEETLPDRTDKKWGYRQMPQSSMYGVDFNIGAK
ncbi:putative cysteine peptidase containing WD40 repe at domain [Sulfurimonas gotlandica GD1]|uniref:Putative cysteine peptidase containing WD40 repe at domain n=1 Tax=Sulfurimonas gotlandica (strain DSM 19862 / JCM 16533 / GD1) TaxID=929558 RepID=B6BHL4_SULGG|nr:caspase family protein [Sulfurimonas gotlandica]EDZ63148.1 caspase domain protein [Sulfurimonas gotlandica GD1]EHP30012.1 putative cysteine peptidase containing WD40 repe at domain [Sulfurimonas gotlandica GD1]